MKKLILLMLILALAAAPVLSCAADENGASQNIPGTAEPGNEAPARETPEEPPEEEPDDTLRFPDLPDVDFGGYVFRILNTMDGALAHNLTKLLADEETGEALNDAIFRRNRRMEEQFGFSLTEIGTTHPNQVRDRARTSVQAGSDDFDLAMTTPDLALGLAQLGFLEMIDRIPHIDLSAPWWDQDMIRDFSIGRRVFFTTSDFSFNHYSVTIPVLFNKQLHAGLGLDCPYTLVREGRWTLDTFGQQARAALRDLNSDGIFDRHDQWGLLSFNYIYTVSMLNGIGARFVAKDADDFPMLNTNTEGFISRFHTLFDVLQTEGWLFGGTRGAMGLQHMEMFMNNQSLFWIELINTATFLRAMDNDFGILPTPKLNEQQEAFISGTGFPHLKCIPITTADLERTGIILEALSAESRLTTLTVYYDTMLVNQVMNRDEESAEMLDIIFGNRVYEPGRFMWNAQIAGPIFNAMANRNRDIVSIIERYEAAAIATIERAIDAFIEN